MTERKAPIDRYRLFDVRRCRSYRSFSATGGTSSIVPSRGFWTSTSAPASTETICSQISPVSASIGHPYARSSGIDTTDHGGTWCVKIRAGPARFNWTMIISRLVFIDGFCTVLNCNVIGHHAIRSKMNLNILFAFYGSLWFWVRSKMLDLCEQKFLLYIACNGTSKLEDFISLF